MSILDLYSKAEPRTDADLAELFPPRSDVLTQIASQRYSDIIVIGGGIHGAMFARLAALHGLRVLLLERNDYAWATSSRSSKMIHGGLRYLEFFDFRQVWEGLRAREELLASAPHLVRAQEFLIPLAPEQGWLKFKLGWGLSFYDLMLRDRARRHHWLTAAQLQMQVGANLGSRFAGAFSFYDALMDDARLVIENIIAARQEGALCLNYARVLALKQLDDGSTMVGWRDELSGKNFECHTGTVINCAGPWAASVGRLGAGAESGELRFSRGTHLLFNVQWRDPAILRYARDKQPHYFIWPHFAGALVGPSEVELPALEEDPQPSQAEIEDLLSRLRRDFPDCGLDRSTLHYAFAGVRSMVRRSSRSASVDLSRRHVWNYSRGMLTLLGGKFTTAAWSVNEGFRLMCKMSGLKLRMANLRGRKLPGAVPSSAVQDFISRCRESNVSEGVASQVISRLGARARFLTKSEDYRVIGDYCLAGEVRLAAVVEQVEKLSDLVRRRLGLEYMPGHGYDSWDELLSELRKFNPAMGTSAEKETYRSDINTIRARLGMTELA